MGANQTCWDPKVFQKSPISSRQSEQLDPVVPENIFNLTVRQPLRPAGPLHGTQMVQTCEYRMRIPGIKLLFSDWRIVVHLMKHIIDRR